MKSCIIEEAGKVDHSRRELSRYL